MSTIDLVFRTVGERTSQIALDLAIKNIQPHRVHMIENVKPFAKAVQYMLTLEYNCDFVVFVDADCLILEDLVPFLQGNTLAYVDCYVLDKFRGYQHCGVHITRIDIVRGMAAAQIPEEQREHRRYVLRPEGRLRTLVLDELGEKKVFKHFKIFHDFGQFHQDIFAKYALRELRDGKKDYLQTQLSINQTYWSKQDETLDFQVAELAREYIRETVQDNISPQKLAQLVADLPQIAAQQLEKANFPEKGALSWQEVLDLADNTDFKIWRYFSQKTKVFGIALDLKAVAILFQCLNELGINLLPYPDKSKLPASVGEKNDFSLLKHFDGIVDITSTVFNFQLDQLYPNSKFILVLREKASWLTMIEDQWSLLDPLTCQVVFGTDNFNAEQLSQIYDSYNENIVKHFQDRPGSLLIMNIDHEDGWEKLCDFLDLPIPTEPFPRKVRSSNLV